MKITYQLTPRDFQEALRTSRAQKIFFVIIVLGVCFVLFLLGVGWANNRLHEAWRNSMPFIAVLAVWILLAAVIPYYSANKQFKSMSSAQAPITFEASDEGVRMETRNGNSQTAWSAFPKWREQKSVFIIYCSAYVFYLIPKRAFASGEEAQFRQLLTVKISKKV